jgi:hypothetical protein
VVTDRAEQAPSLMMFVTTADRLVTGQVTADPAVPEMVVGMMIAATTVVEATPAVQAPTEVAGLHTEAETAAIAADVMARCAPRNCVRAAASTAMSVGTRNLTALSLSVTMVHPVALRTDVAVTTTRDAAIHAADLLPTEAATSDPASLTETDAGNRPRP